MTLGPGSTPSTCSRPLGDLHLSTPSVRAGTSRRYVVQGHTSATRSGGLVRVPAENAAISAASIPRSGPTRTSPHGLSFPRLGMSFDWTLQLHTSDPSTTDGRSGWSSGSSTGPRLSKKRRPTGVRTINGPRERAGGQRSSSGGGTPVSRKTDSVFSRSPTRAAPARRHAGSRVARTRLRCTELDRPLRGRVVEFEIAETATGRMCSRRGGYICGRHFLVSRWHPLVPELAEAGGVRRGRRMTGGAPLAPLTRSREADTPRR